MIIPYSTETVLKRWPVGNLLYIGGCVIFFLVLLGDGFSEGLLEAMILDGWSPVGLLGYQFIHAGFGHLLFNMLYLWVFGNAVCEKTGNLAYAGIILLCGTLAGVIHNIMHGASAVGASGAVNGIIGFYLVLYPINRVNCFYWFIRPGTFQISGYWLILFWFVVDAWHALAGSETGIAYWSHVGGFLAGFGIGIAFLVTGKVQMARYDNPTLLDYMKKKKKKTGAKGSATTISDPMSALATSMVRRAGKPMPPAAEESLDIQCPHCERDLGIPAAMIGQSFPCPACGGVIELQEDTA